jgi:hypothetical protein
MLGILRSFVIAGLVGCSLLAGGSSDGRAGDPTWGRIQPSSRSSKTSEFNTAYYYNNAPSTSVAPSAPGLPAPTADPAKSNAVTYRSYSPDPRSSSGSYYYAPGPCGCYYYVPGPIPAVASSPASSATASAATAANGNSGTYRSFSPDTSASANYSSYPGAYPAAGTYPSSRSGRSWSGRR